LGAEGNEHMEALLSAQFFHEPSTAPKIVLIKNHKNLYLTWNHRHKNVIIHKTGV
jgi:hypothetical protein